MKRLLAALAALLLFAACGTDPATDVTYDKATLHGKLGCQEGSYTQNAQFEVSNDGEFIKAGPLIPYTCNNEAGTEKDITQTVTNLDHDSHYVFRLHSDDTTWWDADGTMNGINYDSFDTDTFPTVGVRATSQFRDSEGVNVKDSYVDLAPYATPGPTEAALQQLGIRRVRVGAHVFPDGISNGGWDRQVYQWPRLAAKGIKGEVGFTGCVSDYSQLAQKLTRLKRDIPSIASFVESWENPNEVNFQHSACSTTNWQANTKAYAQTLKSETTKQNLIRPILGPSCGGWHCEDQLGDLSPLVDGGNSHPYRGTGIPETAVEQECPYATKYAPGEPCYITEFGWALSDWAGGDERVQAGYTIRAFLDYLQKGVPRSFVHQLVDLGNVNYYCGTPTPPAGSACEHEGTFGLYKWDWTPRLAALALGRMNQFIGDGSAALTPLAFQLDSPVSIRRMVMRNSQGEYIIALWRQVPYGANTNQLVTLTLPDAQSVELSRPTWFPGSVPVTLNGDKLSLNVSADPEFLKITPEP